MPVVARRDFCGGCSSERGAEREFGIGFVVEVVVDCAADDLRHGQALGLGNPVDALRMLKKAEAASLGPPGQRWPFEVEPPKWSRELIARILREEAITAVRNDR